MERRRRQWRRQWHPTPILLPGISHGRRSLVGCSPWDHEKSDTTKWLHFHFSLACIREGKGNPLQCSCLENPRDGRAWWAAVYGVTQSQPWLKQLSSSSKQCMYVSTALSIHPTFPQLCPHICALCLSLYSCPANRFTSTIFLDSTYVCQYMIVVLLFLFFSTLWQTI